MARRAQAPLRLALVCALAMLAALRPAQAADKVVAGSLGGQAPLWAIYVAVHKGFFAAEGIDLELNFAHSGAAVVQQLTAGSLDVALSVGITTPMHAIDKGAPVALVRVIGNSAPYVVVGKPGLKGLPDLKGKTISVGQLQRHRHRLFRADDGGARVQEGRLRTDLGGRRGRALRRRQGRRRGRGDRAAAAQLPGRGRGLPVTLGLAADYVKDLPFTGMAVNRRWAAANLPVARRILAATDKSIAWFADPANRAEAIELLVKHARSSKEDAEASYDHLRRIDFFEPGSKVSRSRLRNLLEVEKASGNLSAALTIERLAMPGLTELTD